MSVVKPIRLTDVERMHILEVLDMNGGNRTHTARALGIGIRTLQRKLKEYGADHLPSEWRTQVGRHPKYDVSKAKVVDAVEEHGTVTLAAKALGVPYHTVYNKLKQAT